MRARREAHGGNSTARRENADTHAIKFHVTRSKREIVDAHTSVPTRRATSTAKPSILLLLGGRLPLLAPPSDAWWATSTSVTGRRAVQLLASVGHGSLKTALKC